MGAHRIYVTLRPLAEDQVRSRFAKFPPIPRVLIRDRLGVKHPSLRPLVDDVIVQLLVHALVVQSGLVRFFPGEDGYRRHGRIVHEGDGG